MSNWAGSTTCLSFLRELLEAGHDFRLDIFRLALYDSTAMLNAQTAAYTEEGELLPVDGYSTGGKQIQVDPPLIVSNAAIVPFWTVVWTPAAFKARGALCYNASRPGLPSVFILDFGALREANGINFAVQFPGPDPNAAIVRLL